jgi:hypothetical protein
MKAVARRVSAYVVGTSIVIAMMSTAAAQAPVINAVVEHRAVAGGLTREVQAVVQRGSTAWIGYRVPMLRSRDWRLNTSASCCGRCRLEPPSELVVLARVETKAIVELRPVGVDCDIDAGGAPLVWLDNVRADESVAWLTTIASDRAATTRRVWESALTAIALHADRSANDVLVTFARQGDATLKGKALFWLAQRAADQALPAITAAIDNDPDTQVKRQAVFALSRMPTEQGIPRLIDLAKSHSNPVVRRQAMFWLGQSKDPRAVDFFAEILLR